MFFLTQDLEYVHSFVPDIWNKIQGRNRDIMGIPIGIERGVMLN